MQGQNAPRREFSEIEYNAQRMNDVEIPVSKPKLSKSHCHLLLALQTGTARREVGTAASKHSSHLR